jgi:uncharacterized protein involved in exopolysaccharide biosynthesis
MEFHRIWRILIGNKLLLILLPTIATCVGLGLTYILPEQYESTALVLVRPIEEIKFDPSSGYRKEIRDFPVNLSARIDAPSKTFVEVIKSPAVAMKIVHALRLDIEKPKQYETVFGSIKNQVKNWFKSIALTVPNYLKYGRDISASPLDLAVAGIEKKLVVSVREDTYTFEITYRSSDPNEAAAVANMAAEIFLDDSSEAYRIESARARQFIETQVDESHKALEQARAATLAYKNSGGTFKLKDEYAVQLKIVSDLEITLAKAEGELAGRRLTAKRARVTDTIAIAQEAEIADLKEQISALRIQLAAYPKKERQMNAITLNERLAEQSYEFFLKRYEEARVKEAATIKEIRIVSRAVPGLYPVKPLKYMNAGLSFATAMLVAIGWALLLERAAHVVC